MADWTDEREAAVLARCEKATTGPWWCEADRVSSRRCVVVRSGALYGRDADFIAHGRTDLPDAIAELRRVRADRDRLLAWWRKMKTYDVQPPVSEADEAWLAEMIERHGLHEADDG